jgi:uncharacterized membrane protein
MEPENKDAEKYYKFLFYFDHTSKKIIIYDPNLNRYTLNFANKWSYLIMSFSLILVLLGVIVRTSR